MATGTGRGELSAAPEDAYAIVADPVRLPDWDLTYEEVTPLATDSEVQAFEARRFVAGREMRLKCMVTASEANKHFSFRCDGEAGEHVEESITLAPGKSGNTSISRETELSLGGVDPLAVIPAQTYTQAWLDRDVEQSLARLGSLVGQNEVSKQRS